MELNDLKEYLGIVVDMEQSIYLLDTTISELNNTISRLGEPKSFYEPKRRPVQPNKPEPVVRENVEKKHPSFGCGQVFAVVLILLGLIFLFTGFTGPVIVGICLIAFGLCCILPSFIKADQDYNRNIQSAEESRKKEENRRKSEYDKAMSKYKMEFSDYERRMTEYRANVSFDETRVNSENILKEKLFKKLKLLEAQRSESSEILNQIYSINIVLPKYRNLAMMCSIYEYLCSGRCTTLEGPDGAYNILEVEVRLDQIIVQLDRVIRELARIKNNQFMLYNAIQENNQIQEQILGTTNQIVSSLDEINETSLKIYGSAEEFKAKMDSVGKKIESVGKKIESVDNNSAIVAYSSERVQKEIEYMNTMNYLESKYRGTGFNQPPSWRS